MHVSQTRSYLPKRAPSSRRSHFDLEHLSQTSSPLTRQWCRRLVVVKRTAQSEQCGASRSKSGTATFFSTFVATTWRSGGAREGLRRVRVRKPSLRSNRRAAAARRASRTEPPLFSMCFLSAVLHAASHEFASGSELRITTNERTCERASDGARARVSVFFKARGNDRRGRIHNQREGHVSERGAIADGTFAFRRRPNHASRAIHSARLRTLGLLLLATTAATQCGYKRARTRRRAAARTSPIPNRPNHAHTHTRTTAPPSYAQQHLR